MSSRVSGILRMARAASTRRKLGVRYASKALPSACPSCSAPLPTPLPACPKCSFISPVSLEVPKHELFGIDYEPNPFIIDTSALRHKFRELQRVVHPDVWSGSDKQDVAVNLSAYVNESFKTLLAPVPRAEYILSRNGIHLSETDNLDDSELIMEIMDAREGLEEASSRDEADSILAGVEDKCRDTSRNLSDAVERRCWEDVKRLSIRLKYLENMVDAAKAWPEMVFSH